MIYLAIKMIHFAISVALLIGVNIFPLKAVDTVAEVQYSHFDLWTVLMHMNDLFPLWLNFDSCVDIVIDFLRFIQFNVRNLVLYQPSHRTI